MSHEWIKWNGGENPFNDSTYLEIELSKGDIIFDWSDCLDWQHLGDEEDIIAYRVFTESPLTLEERIEELEYRLDILSKKLQMHI